MRSFLRWTLVSAMVALQMVSTITMIATATAAIATTTTTPTTNRNNNNNNDNQIMHMEHVDMPSPGADSVALMESLFSSIVVPPTVPFKENPLYPPPPPPPATNNNIDLDNDKNKKSASSSASASSSSPANSRSTATTNNDASPLVSLHRRAPPAPASSSKNTTGAGSGASAVCGECDPTDPLHGGCCTSDCKRMPDYRTGCSIQGYWGACRGGQCVTRHHQCSRYDSKTLLVGESALRGPFVPCLPSSSSGGGNSGNTLDNVERKCTLACQGRAASSGVAQLCLDFQDYANVERFVVNGALCGNSAAASTLGLCWDGTCVNEACRRFRCTNHGECVRSRLGGGSECRCDSGFAGEACNKMDGCDGLVDVCGVCNGDGSSCPLMTVGQGSFFASGTFKLIVLPVGLTLLVTVIALATLLMVRRKKQAANANAMGGAGGMGGDGSGAHGGGGVLSSSFFKSKIPHKLGMSVSWDEYRCVHSYEQTMPDELELNEGDILFKLFEYDDGWAKGYNTRTQEEGIYPVSFTEKVTPGTGAAVAAAQGAAAAQQAAAQGGAGRRLSTPSMIASLGLRSDSNADHAARSQVARFS